VTLLTTVDVETWVVVCVDVETWVVVWVCTGMLDGSAREKM